MAWFYVVVAGVFEMLSVNYMNVWKKSKKAIDVVKISTFFFLSLVLLHLAMRTLPMSVTYAVWSGIGSAGAIIFGIILYGEDAGKLRILFIAMILGAVVGLKYFS